MTNVGDGFFLANHLSGAGSAMLDDPTGDKQLSSPMTVRELMARLKNVDPDFLIVIGADAQSLIVVNPKPGFCCPEELEQDEASHFTELDLKFLGKLHIK